MVGKTLTRADLSEAVYQQVGLSRSESSNLVESVLEEICKAAVRGETIKLSSFGTFTIRSKNERIGRNPKTGESADHAAPSDGVQAFEYHEGKGASGQSRSREVN